MQNIKNKNSTINDAPIQQEEDFLIPFEVESENLETADQENTLDKAESEKKDYAHLAEFMQEMEKYSQPEAKIKHALTFMETSLAQTGSPHFKTFWDVRHLCLQLFKENLSPTLRGQLWSQYSELSKEARRLKEILDEQSSFAAEQIEIAILAIENDIESFEELLSKTEMPDLSFMPQAMNQKKDYYTQIQKRLNLLNVKASRINSLRKELIKTEMRIKQKNKFFQRLSTAGDKVFPVRKDLIKEISHSFTEEVDNFINSHFTNQFNEALFVLRDEIKNLQGIAKILTLNTHAFTQIRMRLSECWDKIKVAEKERKKEKALLKVAFKENFDLVQGKIQDYKKRFEAGELLDNQAEKQIEEISRFMRTVKLGREEIQSLRESIAEERNRLVEKNKIQEQQRLQQEKERDKQRQVKIDALKDEVTQFSQQLPSFDSQELIPRHEDLLKKVQSFSLTKTEKQEIDRLLKPLRNQITDLLSDKEEKAILALSEDDRQAIEQLKEVLKQRKERRTEIKNQLETLRRATSGTSGLNFEKAMNNNVLILSERERLEKIDQGIKEVEDKIAELQKKK